MAATPSVCIYKTIAELTSFNETCPSKKQIFSLPRSTHENKNCERSKACREDTRRQYFLQHQTDFGSRKTRKSPWTLKQFSTTRLTEQTTLKEKNDLLKVKMKYYVNNNVGILESLKQF